MFLRPSSRNKEPAIPLITHAQESAERITREALERYPGHIALAVSFGGPSGMALLDLTLRIDPDVPVYYLDTGLLFPETYALVERASRRYGIEPIAVRPELSLEAQANQYGDSLWASDPDRCCALRKVAPQRAFLRGFDAWLTGIRRAQSDQRGGIEPVAWDESAELAKISPLYDWSDEDVWRYVNDHDVPVNVLHADGYPSIGCVPCTRRVAEGEDARAGRWAGFAKTECGLHLPPAETPR
ncbi:MAG TPA: phosphoadenylyl-sulfate reductase [Candidatus Acidoferrum sp.]|nr:phosphoadenylyl-sulfate reductase [Candidatus Acidoferrum sp.]